MYLYKNRKDENLGCEADICAVVGVWQVGLDDCAVLVVGIALSV